MWKAKWISVLTVGALIGALRFGGRVSGADEGSCTDEVIDQVRMCLEKADITLAEAILTSEQQCNGKAIQAMLGCEQELGAKGLKLKTENYSGFLSREGQDYRGVRG